MKRSNQSLMCGLETVAQNDCPYFGINSLNVTSVDLAENRLTRLGLIRNISINLKNYLAYDI